MNELTLRGKAAIHKKLRSIILAICLVLLPVAALATTALLNGDGFLGWHTVGGSSNVASTGGTYVLNGVAGASGAHQNVATGGSYSLAGGFIPVAVEATPEPPSGNFNWLPIVGGK